MGEYELKGIKLKKLRVAKELRMSDVAEELEMSATSYGKRERGEQEFTIGEFLKLVDIFEMPLEILLDYLIKEV